MHSSPDRTFYSHLTFLEVCFSLNESQSTTYLLFFSFDQWKISFSCHSFIYLFIMGTRSKKIFCGRTSSPHQVFNFCQKTTVRANLVCENNKHTQAQHSGCPAKYVSALSSAELFFTKLQSLVEVCLLLLGCSSGIDKHVILYLKPLHNAFLRPQTWCLLT